MSMPVIPVSVGELADKWTILQIKSERITDSDKTDNIIKEMLMLEKILDPYNTDGEASSLIIWLLNINKRLWDIEDEIRKLEGEDVPVELLDSLAGIPDFGKTNHYNDMIKFVELARDVYITNDKRSKIKRQINELLGSELIEEKSYEEY